MRQWLAVVVVFAAAVFAQSDEETFTIFLDLDDVHVTQLDNHEFLHHSAIGEFDNVLLELSESEMRHFMEKHETHDCHHPEDLHEVVSFIQEKMWTAPVALDESMGTFSEPQFPFQMGQMAQMPAPFPQIQQSPQLQNWFAAQSTPFAQKIQQIIPALTQKMVPNPAPAARPTLAPKPAAVPAPALAASAVSAPVAVPADAAPAISAEAVQAPAPAVAPAAVQSPASEKVTLTIDKSEEEAVQRFINAYHSYKGAAVPAQAAPEMPSAPEMPPAPAASAYPANLFNFPTQQSSTPSLLDSLIDEDDKRMLGMFAPAESVAADSDMDRTISNAVDEALKHALTNEIPTLASMMGFGAPAQQAPAAAPETPAENAEASSSDSSHHHHHHHHHHHQEAEPVEQAQPAVAPETVAPAAAPVAPAPSVNEAAPVQADPSEFSAEERQALKELLKEYAAKANTESATASAPASAQPAPVPAPASAPAAVPSTSEVSQITKAPSSAEVIPESVYSQQLVDFNEKPKPVTHHIPKRILIPRMEEPGPVIGGSSRPVHIQIPPLDDLHGNSRPVAPAEIVAAAKAQAAAAAAKEPAPSIKAATMATETDEALTAPEVVIFNMM